jgi:hypothetical protein
LGQTKFAVQQTALAHLAPCSQRSKARFMNLGVLVKWGVETLFLVDNPSQVKQPETSPDQVQAKLGWLTEYRTALAEWSACMVVIEETLDYVRCRGYNADAGPELDARLPTAIGTAGELREQLLAFVTDQSLRVRQGERLPGTTEILESSFGKLKALEDGQSKSGFTGLETISILLSGLKPVHSSIP